MNETASKPVDNATHFVERCYLQQALQFLEFALEQRLRDYFGLGGSVAPLTRCPQPEEDSELGRFVIRHRLKEHSLLLLLLSLSAYVKADLIDAVVQKVLPNAGDYPQLGGVRGKQHRGFLPTGETVLFLLAGDDLKRRLYWQNQLRGEHELVRKRIIYLDAPPDGEPPMSGRLVMDDEYAELFLYEKIHPPALSLKFPAQLLQTQLTWNDLVLPVHTLTQVKELENWVKLGPVLMQQWQMQKKLRPGLRALFYGPPGTGKTFTATLLGTATGQPVYRIDLSMVVSKYIGETEKNLANLFDKAENKNWILFFDEADALFGKRTQLKDAHDRFANQEVSFLLQRIETYNGLIVLASNLSNNVDEAFSRRFEQIIHFPLPKKRERQQIWEKGLPDSVSLEPGLDLADIANRYEVSGGVIMNVIRHACMQAISRQESLLRKKDVVEGLRREYAKENRLE